MVKAIDESAVRGAAVLCVGGSCGAVEKASGVDVLSSGDIAGGVASQAQDVWLLTR